MNELPHIRDYSDTPEPWEPIEDDAPGGCWIPSDWVAFIIGVIAVLVAASLSLSMCSRAEAHEATNTAGQPLGWQYSFSCCSDKDCKPVAAGEVRETPQGYLLVKTGEVVGYQDTRIKDSPDGTFHVCQVAGDFEKGRILCIYRPSRGF